MQGCSDSQIRFSYGSEEENNPKSALQSSVSFPCRRHFASPQLSSPQLCTHKIRLLFRGSVPPPFNNNSPLWFPLALGWCYTVITKGPQFRPVVITCLDTDCRLCAAASEGTGFCAALSSNLFTFENSRRFSGRILVSNQKYPARVWMGSVRGRGLLVFNMADCNRLGHLSVKQKKEENRPGAPTRAFSVFTLSGVKRLLEAIPAVIRRARGGALLLTLQSAIHLGSLTP